MLAVAEMFGTNTGGKSQFFIRYVYLTPTTRVTRQNLVRSFEKTNMLGQRYRY